MEKWHEMALMVGYEVNFQEHENEIREAFRNICEPIINNDSIEFTGDCICISGKQYKLSIKKHRIEIKHIVEMRGLVINSYAVNEKLEEAYTNGREYATYQKLRSINFDYEAILNNLMNAAIEERPPQITEE